MTAGQSLPVSPPATTSVSFLPKAAVPGLPIYFVCLYFALAPAWAPGITAFRYDNARWLQIGLLAVLTLLLAVPTLAAGVLESWRSLARAPRLLLAIWLLGGAVSASVSRAPALGALELGLVAQLLLLVLCISAGVRKLGSKVEAPMAVAIVAGAALLVLQFWAAQALALADGKAFSWVSPFLQFANVRFFGQYQSYTLLLLTLPAAFLPLSGRWRALTYFVAANFWALQWMVGTRAVWMGFAAAVLAVSLLARTGKLKWLRQQLLLVGGGGLIYLVFTIASATVSQADPIPRQVLLLDRGEQSVLERLTITKGAFELIREHPLLGTGPGQFGLYYSATPAAHPHNSALQLLVEYGLPAGGAGLALVFLIGVRAVGAIRGGTPAGSDTVNVTLGAALIMGLMDSLFSGNLTMPHSQILFCTVCGWFLGRSCSRPQEAGGAAAVRRLQGAAVISTFSVAASMTLLLALDYLSVIRTIPYWLPDRPPHFWQYGRLYHW